MREVSHIISEGLVSLEDVLTKDFSRILTGFNTHADLAYELARISLIIQILSSPHLQ